MDMEKKKSIKSPKRRYINFLLVFAAIEFGILSIVLKIVYNIDENFFVLGILVLSIFVGLKTRNRLFPFAFTLISVLTFSVLWQTFVGVFPLEHMVLFVSEVSLFCGIPGLIFAQVARKKMKKEEVETTREEFYSDSRVHPEEPWKAPATTGPISGDTLSYSVNKPTSRHDVVSYRVKSVFLSEGMYIDEKGIHIPRFVLGDIFIPYALVTRCSYFQKSNKDTCIIEHQDPKGGREIVKVHSSSDDLLGALKAHSDILRISQVHGYRIEPGNNVELTRFIKGLKESGIECELIEPEDLYVKTSRPEESHQCWERKLGTLKLKYGNVNLIEMVESGDAQIIVTHSSSNRSSSTTERIQYSSEYHMNAIVQDESIPQVEVYGNPIKEYRGLRSPLSWVGIALISLDLFLWLTDLGATFIAFLIGLLVTMIGFASEKTTSYKWQGDAFANMLNSDSELVEMLVRSEAPSFEICGNRIQAKSSQFPGENVFHCIDRIAGHMRRLSI